MLSQIEWCYSFNPFMPAGTYMYRQRAKNSNFSDFNDTWQSMQMRGWGSENRIFFSFGHQMGICAKNYKNLPSRFFMGINVLHMIIKEKQCPPFSQMVPQVHCFSPPFLSVLSELQIPSVINCVRIWSIWSKPMHPIIHDKCWINPITSCSA